MCGILAYISKKEISKSKISMLKNLMKCRGPDNQTYKKIFFGNNLLHLFHSRLSIQDLNQRSNQPYTFKNFILIFNGEIYNFKYLKKKLNKKFKTFSDTEIILHYYDIYGEKCFDFFEGMWSIIIYDTKKQKIIVSRDRFGEKPLLIYKKNDEIILSSQINYIHKILESNQQFNSEKINSFLHFGYKSLFKNDQTFFKNITHIQKSSILIIEKNLNIFKKRYWKLKKDKEIEKLSLNEHISNSKKLLIKAIDLRLVSDVPVSLNLSGGIDSGAICSIASKVLGKKLETFSILDSDSRYNEIDLIKATAKDCGVKNNLIKLSNKVDFFDLLKNSTDNNQHPILTITDLIHYYLCSFIKKKGFKVSLSGSGADEIYGGYYDHYLMVFNELRKIDSAMLKKYVNIWETDIRPSIRNPYFTRHDLFFKNSSFRKYVFDNYENNKKYCINKLSYQFKEKKYFKTLLKNRMSNELFHETVPIFTHREDLNSMRFSIESRAPFLDSNLIEYLFNINSSHLLHNCQNKYILRESLRGILNSKVLNQKVKSGFNASILNLFNFKNKKIIRFVENDSEIYKYVHKKTILKLVNNKKLLNQNSYGKFLFSFLSLKLFMDRFN
tara:strand:- start:24280 stop:26112 length:1833 start_codon:yes stop_codon:yes gene_type:complete